MTALIVICIVLSLMGSALWIMPPKKERQRMALRMQARQLNLTVQLTSIDLPDKWDKSMIRKKVVSYSLYRAKPLASLSKPVWILPYEVWKYDSISASFWVSQSMTLTERDKGILSEFEGRIEGIKIHAGSIDFFWQEQGDEACVEAIAELLKSLSSWQPA
ncbi:hypothetical protein [Marinomonas posidonica]|uniref:hypothetical protein n=1 Tax=Marinomonas posidonica TaxID=936476 RepID=UPI0037365877